MTKLELYSVCKSKLSDKVVSHKKLLFDLFLIIFE